MIKIFFLIFFLITKINFSQDNTSKCLSTKLINDETTISPSYLDILNSPKKIKNHQNKTTIEIPIVIHIIHRNSHSNIGSGTNISDEQIEDQIKILNEDYSKTNSEFPNPPRNNFINIAGNANIQFCLATEDPNGNPTTGITRTSTSQINWDADDNSNSTCHEANGMKKTICGGKDGWDPSRYLNIWVCDLTNSQSNGMTLGYAYLPGLLADFNSSNDYKDGLVVDYRWFGSIGIAATQSDGRTATHEIGHYLGLMHTFCEDMDASGNWICCDNDNTNWGGYVDDTPAAKDIYYGVVSSNTNNNTCNDLLYGFSNDQIDMDENYMSYSYNTWMFSQGQVDVMRSTLNRQDWLGGRLNLQNSTVSTNCSGIISSIHNSHNYKFEVYPNPTNGNLKFKGKENISKIFIYNTLNKKISVINTIKNNQIDISNLNNGIYFIKIITTNDEVSVKKIILSK
jgi:hypothetical protein